MNQICVVLFDLGNVLIHIDFGAFWRTLGFLHAEEIVPLMDDYKSLTQDYETGRIQTENYLNGLCGVLNNRFPVGTIEKAFASIIQTPVAGAAEIVERVSKKCRIAL
jgi:FMN phosphatase YigB (HAD superfamily)